MCMCMSVCIHLIWPTYKKNIWQTLVLLTVPWVSFCLVDSLLKVLKHDGVEDYSLEVALDASTKAVLQGGRNFLLVSTFVYLN